MPEILIFTHSVDYIFALNYRNLSIAGWSVSKKCFPKMQSRVIFAFSIFAQVNITNPTR
jgi:hypothetical protein